MGQPQRSLEFMASPLELLRSMTRIRMVEEEIAKRYSQQQMRCPVHLSVGQEAAAVGVCAALEQRDWVFSGHRNHAHYLAKGGNLKAMLAEIYGKTTGCCGGRGGSMHLTDQSAGFIAATPIVGSTVPIAVGAALTAQREGNGRVVVVFLGDGAMEAGVVHESLNFAALKGLPILFACENNFYSVYSPLNVRQPANRSISDVAAGHGVTTLNADGNNVLEVYTKAKSAVQELRQGKGPIFIELPTYRWLEHCGPGYDNNIGYRTEEEFQEWKHRDPLRIASQHSAIALDATTLKAISQEIHEAFASAISDPLPDPALASNLVYATQTTPSPPPKKGKRQITYAEALREAQDICLDKHSNSYLMGLGVPDPKGIFGTTVGLQEKYGEERVFDIPLAENAMTGVALGSAITGMRPVLTHQRLDFALVSIDQIVNQAAKWHYMFNGKMDVPLVVRMIIGRGWGQGPQHSQNLQSWFAHVPGLRVLVPSSPYDAKGMLIAAIEDNNPVVMIEHRWLHQVRGNVPIGTYRCSLRSSSCVVEGSDVTIVSIGYSVVESIAAANLLAKLGIRAEVIDMRVLQPLDMEAVINSVDKTRRIIVVDDAHMTCGIGSEIITRVVELYDGPLIGKPIRMTWPDYPCPTSSALTKEYYHNSRAIARSVLKLIGAKINLPEDTELENKMHDVANNSYIGPF